VTARFVLPIDRMKALLLVTGIALALASTSTAPADNKGKSFGAACESDSDCASNVCSKGKRHKYCSVRCKVDSDCPKPPSVGICNDRGYCKR